MGIKRECDVATEEVLLDEFEEVMNNAADRLH
jgi:hypothetical protein